MLRSETDEAKRQEAIAREFYRLMRQWLEETGGLSSPRKIMDSPAYQQMIAMGWEAVPLFLREIQQGRGMFMGFALKKITGEDPTDESMRGRGDIIDKAWLNWGKENKHI